MKEAIFDAELNIAGAAAPPLVRCVAEAQRKCCGELDPLNRTVVEIETSIFIDGRAVTFSSRERVNLPVAGVGRHRIIGEIRRTRQRWSRHANKSKRGETVNKHHAWASAWPGCRPARCGSMRINTRITIASAADAMGRLSSRPPFASGLSRKSPTVAPSGRVRMNAAQKRKTRLILVAK